MAFLMIAVRVKKDLADVSLAPNYNSFQIPPRACIMFTLLVSAY
ncbi:hypothetical protein COLO4_37668 [Corchorus olitorius]|uniref:Uncharacterized protein n=1 Tax=Corchorus olitorius TaxID=93759 RepID=A0A1R3G0A2_9ROSI|nr:hypothetical protein COLO4_37668 [Corchorus olitorius]